MKQSGAIARWVGVALQITAVIVVALLVLQNLKYRRLLNARIAACHRLEVGDRLPGLRLTNLVGRTVVLDFRQTRTVIAIVEPSCASCAQTIANARLERDVKVISVSSASVTLPVARSAGIVPNTFTIPDRSLSANLLRKVRYYPQIVLVDRGIVTRSCVDLKECRG